VNALDNPVWSALSSVHSEHALGGPRAKRYEPEIAPFVAVENEGDVVAEIEAIVAPGERVYFIGPAPTLPTTFQHAAPHTIVQMVCTDRPPAFRSNGQVTTLTTEHAADMAALTAVVYPAFFRPRTHTLGTYLGIYEDARLVAMAGERMAITGHVELSAICTLTGYTGHGYARHLTTLLMHAALDRGLVPFLHVSPQNERAKVLYESLGFRARNEIALRGVTRPDE
jgi:GNAT superfamily N-acetyltransferase